MFTRRNFLAAASMASLSVLSPINLRAMDPIVRKKPAKLRLSLAAYSMRKYLAAKGKDKKMDLFEFVEYCHGLGITGVELTSYYFPEKVTTEYLSKLKMHCHVLGMTISGGAIRNDFCSNNSEKVEKDLQHTREWIDYYAHLGVPVIRIFAGDAQKNEEMPVTLERCAKNCELACKYGAEKGVMLALENHGGVTAKATGLLDIVKQVNSPAFGVNFDSGNFHSTLDPYSELEMIAPYAVNAQIKVEMQVEGKKAEADLPRIVQILRGVNYSGWVALEYESAEEPLEAIPRWLDKLKPLMDG
ncbi:MAG: sugar phosphate isomerase/epimerase family protein [Pirellulales bacterium]